MFKVILVDDDEALRERISKELKLQNFIVKSFPNGSGVVQEIQKSDYDLIITDIVMPDKEGIETIYSIREINHTIPILAVSGGGRFTAEMVLEMAQVIGANGTLIKPFEMKELIKKINEILDLK